MALTPAEKQKRYRERLKQNVEKYAESKRKHREHYHKTKRLVKDLTPKEKKYANKIWKLRQREYRQRKKNLQMILDVTPPSSPASSVVNFRVQANQTPPAASPSSISSRKQGRKKVKRDRSKLYKENKRLREVIEKLKKKYEKYKKRSNRTKFFKESEINKKVNEKYTLLANSIKERYTKIKSHKQKKLFKSILTNERIEKCRKKNELLRDVFGINREYATKVPVNNDPMLLRKKIHKFFLRDDISRATAGRKETVTRNGKKMQKRYLLDTMKSIYKDFKSENVGILCSYFYFTKNRPFYIVKPSVDARETCLCKIHANFAHKARALKKHGIIKTDNLNEIIQATVCNDRSKDCMYNVCKTCKNKKMEYNQDKINETIKYYEWIRKEERYEKDGKKLKKIKNVKEELSDDSTNFLQKFEKDAVSLKKHIYNIKSQFHNFRQCLNNLKPNECAVIVDFSENYSCKYNEEVQSHHFGGSRQQISLHTVMVYTYSMDIKYEAHSFCTISSSNCHQPAAIWAHLDPIMQWIRNEYESVDTIHFFSDGPSTQYRQKQNFYLLATKFFDYGFAATTWSFFEAGHGKGPADGIGGFLKRTADKIVATGSDIANVTQFMEQLKNISKIKLFLIEEVSIQENQHMLPNTIPRLLGTLKVHHVFTEHRNSLKYRSLSCFCESIKRGFCECLNPQIYNVNNIEFTLQESSDEDNIECARKESSDDDVPLSSFAVLKEVQNRPSIYKTVYGSSDSESEDLQVATSNKENSRKIISIAKCALDESFDPQPSTSNNEHSNYMHVVIGDFLHVQVYSNDPKKTYSYVCKALTPIEDDGEVKVMFLRVVGKTDAKRFRLDDQDISYVDFKDIIKILPTPAIMKRGHRIYYQFETSIDVFEK